MKLTVRQLKSLITEAMAPAPEQRAEGIVNDTVDAATNFVDSLVAGDVDNEAAMKLQDLASKALSLSKWLQTNHNPKAPALTKFAQTAQEISKSVGFWSRPSFLGRDEYLEKMKSSVKKLQNAQIAVVSH